MNVLILVGFAVLVPGAQPAASAAGTQCEIRVLRPVTDDLGNAWPAGKILPVDIERKSPSGDAYCAHGGSCIPHRVDQAEVTRLINCRVGRSITDTDFLLVPLVGSKK